MQRRSKESQAPVKSCIQPVEEDSWQELRPLLDQELVFSRLPDKPKEYVQDRMRSRAADLAALLVRDTTHIYMCGLRGMEDGVEASFRDICGKHGLDWTAIRARMRATGRYHVETY